MKKTVLITGGNTKLDEKIVTKLKEENLEIIVEDQGDEMVVEKNDILPLNLINENNMDYSKNLDISSPKLTLNKRAQKYNKKYW